MKDDELLEMLREVALDDREPVDPRWEALTRGELSEDDAQALIASDPELAALYTPLSPDDIELRPRVESLDGRGLGARGSGRQPDSHSGYPGRVERSVDADSGRSPRGTSGSGRNQEVPPTPEPANRPWRWALLALAVAIVVVFVMLPPSGTPIPDYTIDVSGGIADVRSDERPDVPLLAPGAPVIVRLRPATRTEAPDVRVLVGGQAVDSITVRKAETGAVELRVLALPAGTEAFVVELGEGAEAQRFEVPVRME